MAGSTAPQELSMLAGETRYCAVDFGDTTSGNETTGKLGIGENLTGTPTVAVEEKPTGASDFTIANNIVNTAVVVINGRSVGVGEAVQFTVAAASGQTVGAYILKITCSTDASPAQTLIGRVRVHVDDR